MNTPSLRHLVAIVSCVSGVEDWIDRLEMER